MKARCIRASKKFFIHMEISKRKRRWSTEHLVMIHRTDEEGGDETGRAEVTERERITG